MNSSFDAILKRAPRYDVMEVWVSNLSRCIEQVSLHISLSLRVFPWVKRVKCPSSFCLMRSEN